MCWSRRCRQSCSFCLLTCLMPSVSLTHSSDHTHTLSYITAPPVFKLLCKKMPAFRPILLLLALALSLLVLVTDAFNPFFPAAAARRRPTNIARYTTAEESSSSSTTETPTPTQTPPPPPPTSSSSGGPCKKFPKCDGAMRNRGCDGDGRVMGGIATVPLLGWWPIKVSRNKRIDITKHRALLPLTCLVSQALASLPCSYMTASSQRATPY